MIESRTAAAIAEADALLAILAERENQPQLRPVPSPPGQGQLSRRARYAQGLPPLPCGCHDPAFHLPRCRRDRDAA